MTGAAINLGLGPDEARAVLEEARAEAIRESLDQGLIDGDLAERMLERPFAPGSAMRGPTRLCSTCGARGLFYQNGPD